MAIPKEITLYGIPIKTAIKDGMIEEEGVFGKCLYLKQEIHIDANAANSEMAEQAYCHEAIHWILHLMGRQEMRDDEELVEGIAQLAYQAIKTIKY